MTGTAEVTDCDFNFLCLFRGKYRLCFKSESIRVLSSARSVLACHRSKFARDIDVRQRYLKVWKYTSPVATVG